MIDLIIHYFVLVMYGLFFLFWGYNIGISVYEKRNKELEKLEKDLSILKRQILKEQKDRGIIWD